MFQSLNFGEFDSIFQNLNFTVKTGVADTIKNERNAIYSYPEEWMNTTKQSFTLDSLRFSDFCPRFSVNIENVDYECLFLAKNNSNRLYVSLSGGRKKRHTYPYFLRWKYGNRLNGNILCIEDPMQFNEKNNCVKWYYGTKDSCYLHKVLEIVKKAARDLNICPEDIYFLGSSGGGYAALYLANLLDGSNAIAMSPQTVLKNWGESSLEYFRTKGIDITNRNDCFNRNYLKLTNKKSVFFIVVNVNSYKDYDRQFIPFCKINNIIPQYGIYQQNNVITWSHASDGFNLHGSNPEYEIMFMIFLMQQYRKNKNINSITKYSYLINERLSAYYKLDNLYQTTIIKHNFVMQSLTKKRIHVRGAFLGYNSKEQTLCFYPDGEANANYVKLYIIDDEHCVLKIGKKAYISSDGKISSTKTSIPYLINPNSTISFFIDNSYIGCSDNRITGYLAPEKCTYFSLAA